MIDRQRAGAVLLVFAITAIAVATLTPAPGAGGATTRICLICHSRGMSDFLSNIILFAPLGFALSLRRVSLWRAAAAGFLFSLTIELLQLDLIPGRDSNVGDFVANSLGAVLGWWFEQTVNWWRPRPDGAFRRSAALTIAALLILFGGLVLLVPRPLDTDYYMQWTARFGGLAHYDGEVIETSLGTLDLARASRIQQVDSVRTLLVEPKWSIRFVAGDAPPWLAPLVSIYDGLQREVMLLGIAETHLVYRQRLLAGELRFDQPDLRVYFALDGVQPGDTVNLTWRGERVGICANVNGQQHCRHGYTVGDTWALLLFPDFWGRLMRSAMSAVWLFGAFVPAGFLAYRGPQLAAVVAVMLGSLLVVPPLLGFTPTPLWQMAASSMGLAGGFVAARAVERRIESTTRIDRLR